MPSKERRAGRPGDRGARCGQGRREGAAQWRRPAGGKRFLGKDPSRQFAEEAGGGTAAGARDGRDGHQQSGDVGVAGDGHDSTAVGTLGDGASEMTVEEVGIGHVALREGAAQIREPSRAMPQAFGWRAPCSRHNSRRIAAWRGSSAS